MIYIVLHYVVDIRWADLLCIFVRLLFEDVALNIIVFFFKQKTAYEMRISDWSSDVCSSDLRGRVMANRAVISNGLATMSVANEWMPTIRAVVFGKIGRASCRERVCQYV